MERDKVVEIGRTLSQMSKKSNIQVVIICANYGATQGASLKKCDGMWCSTCFVPSDLNPCHIAVPEDFTGATIAELGKQERFMQARPGDYLCTSFQCPNCQSQNIRGKDLDTSRSIADASFESLWTDLAVLHYDLEYCENRKDFSAVAWLVTGRFKNEHGLWNHYIIPIAGVTGSGIRVFEWAQRVVRRLELVGRIDGWMFRKRDGVQRALAGDYAENIYRKLEYLRQTTNLINPGCNIRKGYRIQ
ncbi:hypothetical protein ACHAWO_006761 [Cyclotella atomus]|uniref:Uncharacterized protein n=1 Tax=Cyclotella atomus TaxID=382360 RepID=A0ABD3MX13_9STRA